MQNNINTLKQQNGFTLIELLIAIAIVGILASVAITSFSSNVISSNRTDGRATILETSIVLEKCKAIYGTYNNANCSVDGDSSITSKEGFYTITAAVAATTFTITATPVAGKTQASDTECTKMTLTHLAVKSGTGTNVDSCW